MTGKVTVTVLPGPRFEFIVEGVADEDIPLFVRGVAEALEESARVNAYAPVPDTGEPNLPA